MSTPTRRDFTNARSNAKRRGKSWDLTFEQWARVWMKSGKYAERGRRKGQYQMDRRDASGGYTEQNVQIIAGHLNRTKDSPHGWRPKLDPGRVVAIRADFSPRRITRAMLAEQHGVSVACIKAVLSNRNWSGI